MSDQIISNDGMYTFVVIYPLWHSACMSLCLSLRSELNPRAGSDGSAHHHSHIR